MLSKSIKKIIPYQPFHRAIDENFEDSRIVLAVSVSQFYHQSIAVQLEQPKRWLLLLYVYKETIVSIIRESLSICVRH